ncbi:MAG TPA: addiction module protein [Pirellulales bacterium]|nr:addiction module protein [Pirellulales bacterium]
MSTANEVFAQALGLPEDARASLARQLLLSLETDDFDSDSEAAWAIEIEARLAAVERGGYAAQDWREALAEIRSRLPKEPNS